MLPFRFGIHLLMKADVNAQRVYWNGLCQDPTAAHQEKLVMMFNEITQQEQGKTINNTEKSLHKVSSGPGDTAY